MDNSFLSNADLKSGHSIDSELPELHQIDQSHFSLNVMTTIRWNLLQDLYSCKESGINTLGLWRNKIESFGVPKAIEFIKEEGINVSSLSFAGGFTGSHEMSFIDAVEDGLAAIDLAHALGSPTLTIVTGAVGTHIENHAFKTVVNGLNWMADFAAEKNVTLALLPMHQSFQSKWTFVNSIDKTLDMINACNHPRVKMALNTYHMGCESQIVNKISSIIDYIDIVQIADCKTVPTFENDRCFPGEGILPVSEIVTALIENGYHNYFEFDLWSKELWKSDYSELISNCQSGFVELIKNKEQQVSQVCS